jgi:hypothetical protein
LEDFRHAPVAARLMFTRIVIAKAAINLANLRRVPMAREFDTD